MRALTYWTMAVLFVLIQHGAAEAARRVALFIGNSDYEHVTRLTNPKNDATVLAQKFREIGFDQVTLKLDLNTTALRRTLGQFSREAAGADTAVIYFAGHGIEVDGTNYLIPIDAKLSHVDDVDFEAIELRKLMRSLNRARQLKLVILDACRNNPFKNNMEGVGGGRSIGRGLARVNPTGSDTLVAYASREGTIAADGDGKHSPFAQALIKHVTTPGLDVRILFGRVRDDVLKATGRKQEPFTYGSLPGRSIFLRGPDPASAPTPSVSTDVQHQIEELRRQLQQKDGIARQLAELQKALAKRQQSSQTIAELSMSLERQKAEIEKLKRQTATGRQKLSSLPPASIALAETHQTAQELFASGKIKLLRGDPRGAVEDWRRASGKGHSGASFELGRAYERGSGIRRNIETARSLYRKAVAEGSDRAKKALARLRLGGGGSQGTVSVTAVLTAQELYANGKIKLLRGNPRGAVEDWRKASNKGHSGAFFELGRAYERGRGVGRNVETARTLYRKAITHGSDRARQALAQLGSSGGGSHSQGVVSRTTELTAQELYANGKIKLLRGNPRGAVDDWRRASKKRHAGALFELGRAYERGRGVSINSRAAADYVYRAFQAGFGKSHEHYVEKLQRMGEPVRRAFQRRLRGSGLYSGAIDGKFGARSKRAILRLSKG